MSSPSFTEGKRKKTYRQKGKGIKGILSALRETSLTKNTRANVRHWEKGGNGGGRTHPSPQKARREENLLVDKKRKKEDHPGSERQQGSKFSYLPASGGEKGGGFATFLDLEKRHAFTL